MTSFFTTTKRNPFKEPFGTPPQYLQKNILIMITSHNLQKGQDKDVHYHHYPFCTSPIIKNVDIETTNEPIQATQEPSTITGEDKKEEPTPVVEESKIEEEQTKTVKEQGEG